MSDSSGTQIIGAIVFGTLLTLSLWALLFTVLTVSMRREMHDMRDSFDPETSGGPGRSGSDLYYDDFEDGAVC